MLDGCAFIIIGLKMLFRILLGWQRLILSLRNGSFELQLSVSTNFD